MQLNLYMQPYADKEQQSFWTKASVQHFAKDGSVMQSMLFETVDHTASSVSCAAIGAESPCIANGGAKLTVNGSPVTAPGGKLLHVRMYCVS